MMVISLVVDAKVSTKGPVVIVSSYNPDVKRISDNIHAFSKEYVARGGKSDICVENMNCRNLPEAHEWKNRLRSLLQKYYVGGGRPSVIVLLGTEASTTFFSLDDPQIKQTPVVVGSRGNNILRLTDDLDRENLATWAPHTYYLTKDFADYNIVGGEVYYCDVDKNLKLLKSLYPGRDSILFLSDNTLGGITIRSYFANQMKRHPEFNTVFLDGRVMSFLEVSDVLKKKGDRCAVFIGTWRVDNNDSYTIDNTIATLASSNDSLPAISLTSTGLGLWAIGGYHPAYHTEGGMLADYVCDYEETGKAKPLKLMDNVSRFDYEMLKKYGISRGSLPAGSVIDNKPVSVWEEYETTINLVVVIILCLSLALFITIRYLRMSRRLQDELTKSNKNLMIARDRTEEANNMKSAFIANISHEIRTPLNAVVGFSQIITDPEMPLLDEEKQEYGNYIKTNSDTLLNLVNDILDISKMDAGRMQFNIVEADLVDVCHTATESAKASKPEGVEILEKLPEEPLMVRTDVLRLQQVFNNLFTNAKKYTETGSITLSIDKVDKAKRLIFLSVTDTGTGIPADKAETIFERFKQLDSFKPGTGLGLSITRSIISTLGGRIWLDTNYTNGARFCFTHPF